MKRTTGTNSRKRYRRRLEKKRYLNYILPLAISIALVVLVLLVVNVVVQMTSPFGGVSKAMPIASFQVASEGVSLILEERESPLRQGYQVSINHGEGIVTNDTTRLLIPLANGDILRIAESSKLFFNRKDNGGIELQLEKGAFWVVVEGEKSRNNSTSMKGRFVSMDVFRDATVGVDIKESSEAVYVIDGALQVALQGEKNNEVIKTALIRTGQELYIDESVRDFVTKDANIGVVSEMSTARKDTSWFVWNQVEDRKMDTYEGEAPDPEESNIFITIDSPRQSEKIGTSYTEVNGTYQDGVEEVTVDGIIASLDSDTKTWKVPRVRLQEQGKNTLLISYTYKGDVKQAGSIDVMRQTTAPETPRLSSPANGAVITSDKVTLQGTVGSDVARIKINDYVLQKYQQGDGEWLYYLSYVYGNMKEGRNTYVIYAYDEVGNSSQPLEVTITYEPEITPVKQVETPIIPKKTENTNSVSVKSPTTSNTNDNSTTSTSNTTSATGSGVIITD